MVMVASNEQEPASPHDLEEHDAELESSDGGDLTTTISYIDYTPPPPPPVPPPAKYKLWLVVLVLVFFAVWCAELGQAQQGLTFSGWLNDHAALFLLLWIVVFVMTFSTLDLVVHAFTIHVGGKSYGLKPWMKQPRIQWVHQYDNAPMELVASIVTIFEDGFAIFNPPAGNKELQKPSKPQQFECESKECQVMLKIEQRIKPDKLHEYEAWREKIGRRVRSQPGYIDTVTQPPAHEEGDLHIIYLTFASIETLNDWMTSPSREKLVEELKPLLAVPNVVQLQRDRELPDAFTDLLMRQGESVPPLLPKKWKVTWLTTCGLYFTLLIQETVLPYYFTKWGIDDAHERVKSLVGSIFATFFNSYVLTPLLMMIFWDWVRRKENENDKKEPWRTLNDGIQWIWLKVVVTFAFYGGCLIAWAVRES